MRNDAGGAGALVDPKAHLGGGGLVSTMSDYMKFAEMLRGGGQLNGVRILSPRTVSFMASNHLPNNADLTAFGRPLFAETAFDGVGFGLSVSVTLDPVKAKVSGSVGDYGWGGAASTNFTVLLIHSITVMTTPATTQNAPATNISGARTTVPAANKIAPAIIGAGRDQSSAEPIFIDPIMTNNDPAARAIC